MTDESKLFWIKRDAYKRSICISLKLLKKSIGSESPFSEEEKIYIKQSIEWLKYVQNRHSINEEKLLKKFPKG